MFVCFKSYGEINLKIMGLRGGRNIKRELHKVSLDIFNDKIITFSRKISILVVVIVSNSTELDECTKAVGRCRKESFQVSLAVNHITENRIRKSKPELIICVITRSYDLKLIEKNVKTLQGYYKDKLTSNHLRFCIHEDCDVNHGFLDLLPFDIIQCYTYSNKIGKKTLCKRISHIAADEVVRLYCPSSS
jgi:hypothetical protein